MPSVDLAVDFGTSNTVAVLRRADGRIQSLLFDGSPLLPSAVCREPSGRLLVGRDALAGARMYPGAAELNPKRCVDDGELLLGGIGVPVADAIGAVLRRVVDEAGPVSRVVLTHPVAWGPRRQAVLLTAAARAGLTQPVLLAEPIAAASGLAIDGDVLVYDFGGGTFDASVVRRRASGLAVVNAQGLDDAGGLDVDAAIVASLGVMYAARDPQAWRRLEEPRDAADHRARQQLWDDVRAAKEMLSRTSNAVVHGAGADWPLGREQFERMARPVLNRTVACARSVVLDAGLAPGQLAGVALVGGSSRIPLVATLLHRTFGMPPVVYDQPELAVAEGALLTLAQDAATTAFPAVAPPVDIRPVDAARPVDEARPVDAARPVDVARPVDTARPMDAGLAVDAARPVDAGASTGRRWTRRTTVAAVAAAVLVLSAAAVVVDLWGGGKREGGTGGGSRPGLVGPSGFQPADALDGGASASAGARPSASGSNGAAAGPGGGASTAGRSTTAAATRTPTAQGNAKVCSDYVAMSFTRSSGSGTTPPDLRVRACVDRHGRLTDGADYVWGGGDWLSTTTGSYGNTKGMKISSCANAVLLDQPSNGNGSGPAVAPKGDLGSSGVAKGTAANYKAELTVKFSITDSGGTAWSGSTVVVTSPCFTPS